MSDVKRTVLLVEDSAADAALVTEYLSEIDADSDAPWPDHEVIHVVNLRRAVEAAKELEPDCVLLDLHLPDASGLQAVDRLLVTNPATPIVVLTSVTDRRLADRALESGAQDFLTKDHTLSGALLARTIEHTVRRGEAANALLESNRELASFANMVAHDLRSPLAIAKGMLELVQRQGGETLDPNLAMLVDRAVGALARTTDLVGGLLMYAQAKRPDDVIEPVDLDDVARWAIETIEIGPDQRVSVVSPLPTLTASGPALRQVVQNLVSNALRYSSGERPARVRIEAEAAEDMWIISVIDNGGGIPEEHRELVFAEGERLGQTGDGLGLGLPAVRATIERFRGRVWIEDAPDGRGTSVRFSLPRSTGSES